MIAVKVKVIANEPLIANESILLKVSKIRQCQNQVSIITILPFNWPNFCWSTRPDPDFNLADTILQLLFHI